jgi:glucose/arabinose dehydrogenase
MHRTILLSVVISLTASLGAWAPAAGGIPKDLELALVTSGLSSPVAVRNAGDGSNRLFIVQQGGQIRIWDGNQVLATPFLSVTVGTGSERGLLGLTFHPDYPENGRFFINYTRGGGAGETVIAEYHVSADPDVADPTGTDILRITQDFTNHNGGDIHFGTDGYLYIGMGDGGSGGDPNDRAQDPGQLLGKMLRIDVDGGGFPADCGLTGNYTIPEDNPRRDGPGGDCDEIWALGLRNPWRWSFDRSTHDLLIGDVGQLTIEEIDFQPAASPGGENYGWNCFEGNNVYNTDGPFCNDPGPLVPPILTYGHSGGSCAVVGGFRYRGPIIGLRGTYIFSDNCSGRIWFATENGGSWSFFEWQDTPYLVSSFGEDEAGHLYVVNLSGAFYRFSSATGESEIFSDGFESGDLSRWSSSVP